MKADKGYIWISTVSTTFIESIWVCTKEKYHGIWDEFLDLPLPCSGLYWLSRASQWWQWWLNAILGKYRGETLLRLVWYGNKTIWRYHQQFIRLGTVTNELRSKQKIEMDLSPKPCIRWVFKEHRVEWWFLFVSQLCRICYCFAIGGRHVFGATAGVFSKRTVDKDPPCKVL